MASSALTSAVANFLALRLARPELAHIAWFGEADPLTAPSPIRTLVRIGASPDQTHIDLAAELSALPFRDQQFRCFVVDTGQIQVHKPQHVEQLYRVLDERAPLIFIGSRRANRKAVGNLYGLFRPRVEWHQGAFEAAYSQWPIEPPSLVSQFLSRLAYPQRFVLPHSPQVLVLSKVTPPPPISGLLQPITSRVASAMPAQSLARAKK